MKGFCKRIIACFSVAAMLAAMLGTLGAAAEQEAPVPEVTWVENGENDAQLSISYTDGSGYDGKYSLTALYDSNRALVGVGCGVLDQSGAASYAVNKPAEGAATVKCFIWDDLNTVEPVVPVYETTYDDFKNNIGAVPEFVVPDGALGMRNSFESGLFQIFQKQNTVTYSVDIDETIGAHTGTKCVKVSGRTAENTTLRAKIPRADFGNDKQMTVSAFMKKPATVEGNAEFYIHAIVLDTSSSKNHFNIYSDLVSATNNGWNKVSLKIDFSKVTTQGDCIVELGARTGSEGNYTYIDYYADDFSVICPDAAKPFVFDDTKTDKLKWDFEDGDTSDWVTTNRTSSHIEDTNKWTRVLDAQKLKIEATSVAEFCNTVSSTTDTSVKEPDADAVTTPPEGSTQMLTIETDSSADNKNAHVTGRIKLSRLDLVPGKTYQISFWAFGNSLPRALYIGLVEHSDTQGNPSSFYGGNNIGTPYAGGIIEYKGDYTKNRVAVMPRSWHKYVYSITPDEKNFNSDGFADLCFVMTGDKTIEGSTWNSKDMLKGEKLYLDEIEITEVPAENGVAALVNDGMYTKRATFESDNMDMFSPDTRASVVLTDTEANTGSYCAEFSNRTNNWTSLGSSIKGADISSKITASCFIKKNSLKV